MVILRRRIKDRDGALLVRDEINQQPTFLDAAAYAPDAIKLYEYAVLVTSLRREGYELISIAQLYRDRADCENCQQRFEIDTVF